MALTAASTGLSIAGGIQSSKASQAQATYAGQLADVNAQNADVAARDALERGQLDAVAHGRQVAQLRGQQVVDTAASGIELGFGTPADIAVDTALMANEDRARIAANAGREADSFRISASNYRADAAGSRAAAAAEKSSMLINAGSTLLGGATQLAGTWKKYGPPKAQNTGNRKAA